MSCIRKEGILTPVEHFEFKPNDPRLRPYIATANEVAEFLETPEGQKSPLGQLKRLIQEKGLKFGE